jgi:Family of unknown function (DUF6283)
MKPCKKPCADCPFRKDRPNQKGWLGESRMREIVDLTVLGDAPFACHKTTIQTETDERIIDEEKSLFCAGALLMQKRLNPISSVYSRVMVWAGYMQPDYSDIKGDDVVFDNIVDLIQFHKKVSYEKPNTNRKIK